MASTLPSILLHCPACRVLLFSLPSVSSTVGDLTWTRVKDVPQRKAVLLDARGVGLRLLFHGSWAEQEMKAGQKWLVAYAEVSQNENDAKEVIAWVYDSAYALLISDVEDTPPIQCREMVQF